MKKLYFIAAIFLLSGILVAQNPVISTFPWEEGFEGETFPPEDWSIIQMGAPNWERSTNEALVHSGLGSAYCHSVVPGRTLLITPAIALPNSDVMTLKFYSKAFNATMGASILISTSSNNVWDFKPLKTLIPEEFSENWHEFNIFLANYIGENIYIAFQYEFQGNLSWAIDDIIIAEFQGDFVDAAISAITEPLSETYENLTSAEPVSIVIKNNGNNPLSAFQLKLELNEELIATEIFTNPIPAFGQAEYTFTATLDLSAAGNYEIKVSVIAPNDQVPGNDAKTVTVTNCLPISTFPWIESFEDDNFPPACWSNIHYNGVGMWYRNFFSGQAHSGLSVAQHSSGLDFIGADESWLVTPRVILPVSNEMILQFYTKTLPGNSDVNPSCDILISTSSNDPKSGEFLLVKQLTDEEQTEDWQEISISLNDYLGENIFIAFRYMGLAANQWLIDDIEIYKGLILHTITASVNGGNGFITPTGAVNVVQGNDQGFTISPNTGYQISQVLVDGANNEEAIANGSYMFENIMANHSIEVFFEVLGVTDTELSGFTLYPNPAKDLLKIIRPAVGKAQVEIYNSLGALIHAFENREPEFEINLSGYSAGVYFIRLQDGKGSATKTFVKQ